MASHLQQDVLNAARDAQKAMNDLTATLLLPTEIGAKVRWPHNGVVWRRLGQDSWKPEKHDLADALTWPSSHIISNDFEKVS